MLSVHFNGEVVRHKNMMQIQREVKERNESENRCKYGIHFLSCPVWLKYCIERPEVKKISDFGTCILSNCKDCPNYRQRKKAGTTKKVFTIDWKTYRRISSAAHYMLKESEYKSVFLTLTFPPFIKLHKLTKSFFYDEITNKLFSKFAENLRTNYNCSNYIAVKEYGSKNSRVHFHLLASMPFISFARINDSWCNTISDHCYYSNHALQTDKKSSSVIRNPNRAVRYVCKYISKSYGIKSNTRVVFISNSALIKPVKICEQKYCVNHIDLLKGFKSIRINTYDHVTTFRITDAKEFNIFCQKFLYPLFECTIKATEFHYQKSDKSP